MNLTFLCWYLFYALRVVLDTFQKNRIVSAHKFVIIGGQKQHKSFSPMSNRVNKSVNYLYHSDTNCQ